MEALKSFYKALDSVMIRHIGKRIVLYGYGDGGRYIRWHAKYYHGIVIDYVISRDMSPSQPYDMELFRPSLLSFDYKDVKDAVVWIADKIDDGEKQAIYEAGYREGLNCVDLWRLIYDDADYLGEIQPLQFLEYAYGVDLLTAIPSTEFKKTDPHGCSYRVTTQKEVFSILDQCHCRPRDNDAFFDYGCGKGGALISALEYGFRKVGGVEYQPDIFQALLRNKVLLDITDTKMQITEGDASEYSDIDGYNWFYFFQPFDNAVMEKVLLQLKRSIERTPRKINCILINPHASVLFEKEGFVLWSVFTVEMRQRVVKVYVSEA